MYTKRGIELLKEKIDLIEVISSYVKLKSSGSTYKGICPFHDEKTPSFIIQKGERHYHCFGCGAHGDAISFLMSYLKISFLEAVEVLAERFQVLLEKEEWSERKGDDGPSKEELKEALSKAASFYHYYLLHSDEGHRALTYLYGRGLDLEFVRKFQIGWAPQNEALFTRLMQKLRCSTKALEGAGLVKNFGNGAIRCLFSKRVIFPILDYSGTVIGFSARKISEEMTGPKYVNTPETALFKKSRILYGLSFSRKYIAKERKAILVEGQIDALRLIQEGFNLSVAGQGTALTSAHVGLLSNLGVTQIYLAFDGDEAGKVAAIKGGSLFQSEGIEVYVVALPAGKDPDTILREDGPPFFSSLLDQAPDYLTFLINYFSRDSDLSSPSQKNRIIHSVAKQIRSWEHPLMVHESLRKLAKLMEVPEEYVGLEKREGIDRTLYVKNRGFLSEVDVDPNRVLETDLLRWLFLLGDEEDGLIQLIEDNLQPIHFSTSICRRIFSIYMENFRENRPTDLLSVANNLESVEEQLLFSQIMQKRVDTKRAREGVVETITHILQHHWMREREEIRLQIQSGRCSEEEVLELAKRFDIIKMATPTVKINRTSDHHE